MLPWVPKIASMPSVDCRSANADDGTALAASISPFFNAATIASALVNTRKITWSMAGAPFQ